MRLDRRLPGWLAAALVAVVPTSVLAQGRDSDPARRTDARMTCGTRVTEFVLDWYGRPAEAADLLWELQGSRADKLASVAGVAEAFNSRGLHTQVVRAAAPGVVDWAGPVVYHTVNADGVGHFVVQVPARGQFPRLYWCNAKGFSKQLPAEYAAGLSGVMVLTSETEVGTEALPAVRSGVVPPAARLPLILASGTAAVFAAGFGWVWLRRARPVRGAL